MERFQKIKLFERNFMQNVHSVLGPRREIDPAHLARLENLNIAGLQGQNETIYGKQNRINYSEPWRIVFRILAYLGMLHKAVRREQPLTLSHNLCMGLSWSLALANNLKVDLEKEAWTKFPGVCPYCGQFPCHPSCNTKERPAERKTDLLPRAVGSGSFRKFQTMLRTIYPNNVAQVSAGHMLEELAEVGQGIDHWSGKHEDEYYERIVTELVDVITHICAVASCYNIDLAHEMATVFGAGCPRCRLPECDCKFTTDVQPPIR